MKKWENEKKKLKNGKKWQKSEKMANNWEQIRFNETYIEQTIFLNIRSNSTHRYFG